MPQGRTSRVPFRPNPDGPIPRGNSQPRGGQRSTRSTDIPGATPPPAEGGWGYIPEWGWGNFPPQSAPPNGGGGGEQPPDPGNGGGEQPPDPGTEPGVIFEDTFRGGGLDQGKWWTRYIYGGPDGPGTLDYLNDEVERFRETGNHKFDNNGLHLTAEPRSDQLGGLYPSGMVRSKSLFDLASGEEFYFECRAKVPAGQGIWPAFWLSSDAREPGVMETALWPPEIDIMEIVNNGVEDTTTMLGCRCQVNDWNSNPQKYEGQEADQNFNWEYTVWYAPFDFAHDYHLFGLHYKRPNFTFYCDRSMIYAGVYDWVWNDRQPAPPAHVLCNLAIGGHWAGRHGIDDRAFPQALDVDYIRVYSSLTGNLPQNSIGKDYDIR
jgi:beta-glucanase (GH16 family)